MSQVTKPKAAKAAAKKPSKPVVTKAEREAVRAKRYPKAAEVKKPAAKTVDRKTYTSAAAAAEAAVAEGRDDTAVLQQSPGVFYLGSKRRGIANGAIFMGRALTLHKAPAPAKKTPTKKAGKSVEEMFG
jgi:hypothetical protein